MFLLVIGYESIVYIGYDFKIHEQCIFSITDYHLLEANFVIGYENIRLIKC